jgi:hypothetical protein
MRQIYNSTDNSPEFAELTATTLAGTSCTASFVNRFNEPEPPLQHQHHQQHCDKNASHLSLANLLPSRLAPLLI